MVSRLIKHLWDSRFLKEYGFYIIAFAAMLPALILRDFTPDNELRYVSIAREALEQGHFFAFTNHGVPYADKPPLYLWLCMAGYHLFGTRCLWFTGLFSVIPAFITVAIMDSWSRPVLSPSWRLPVRAMLLTSGLFLGLALTMRMDMMMTMFIVMALYIFSMIYSGHDSCKLRTGFPLCVFAALFTKGPYGLLIPLLVTLVWLALHKRIKEAGRIWGWRSWAIIAGLCAIWFGAVYVEGGSDYLDNLLFRQTMGRAVKSFAHDEPFYYYAISVWYSIAPWSLAVIAAIVAGLSTAEARKEISSVTKFFLVATAVIFILLSLVSSKLAVYLLPAFPFLVYAGGMIMSGIKNRRLTGLLRWCLAIPCFVFLAAPFVLPKGLGAASYIAAGILFLGATGALSVLFLMKTEERLQKSIISISLTILLFLFTAGFALPHLNPSIGYRDLTDKVKTLSGPADTPVYTYKVRRPDNMDVYLGHNITVLEDWDAQSGTPASGVLITRIKDLPEGYTPDAVSGKYAIIKLEK